MCKKLNKFYIFIIIVSMLFCFSCPVLAEDLSGECGDGVLWNLDVDSGIIVISGNGRMTTTPWKTNKNRIKAVEIEDGVLSLANSAFAYCPNLTSVSIGNGITDIAAYSFSGCSKLTNVQFGANTKKIGACAFDNCSSLYEIDISNKVTVIDGGAFGYCTSLENVSLGSGLLSIGNYAFAGCTKLKKVEIPSDVTIVGNYAFSGCSDMGTVSINDKLSIIGNGAFEYCSKLKNIYIPKSVSLIGEQAFNACADLERIEVDGNNRNYCSDENGVLYTKNMQELIQYPASSDKLLFLIPDTVRKIDDWAFYNALNIRYIFIPESVEQIGYASFYECDNLLKVLYGSNEVGASAISEGEQNTSYDSAEKVYGYVYQKGDTDFDGEINVSDVTTLRRYIVGGYNIIMIDDIFDINSDGDINITDVTFLRQYIVGGYGIVINNQTKG